MSEASPRRAHTRLALIEASTKVFAHKGIDASVEELCDAAGFTRGAFYSNFSSKTELCAAVLEHYMMTDLAAVRAALSPELAQTSSAEELIDAAIDNFIALWGVDVDVLLTVHLIRLAAAHDPDLRAAVLKVDAALPGVLFPMLEKALTVRGFTPVLPVDTLMLVLRSVYLGSLLDDYIAGNVDFELLRARIATVLKALVVAPSTPPRD